MALGIYRGGEKYQKLLREPGAGRQKHVQGAAGGKFVEGAESQQNVLANPPVFAAILDGLLIAPLSVLLPAKQHDAPPGHHHIA